MGRHRSPTYKAREADDASDGKTIRIVQTVPDRFAPQDDAFVARLNEQQAERLLQTLEEALQQ